jgi:hypothetical protein
MKNKLSALLLVLVFVFSLSTGIFAEGEIPIGGRSCGQANQPPCPVAAPIEPTEDTTIIKTMLDYLAKIFG